LFELEALETMTVEPRADDVLIAVPLPRLAEASILVRQLERLSVPVRAILDLGPGISFRNTIFHSGDTTFLDLNATPSEAVAYTILKRTFDLAFATLVAILTAPLMLLIAAAIRLTSPGPVLFAQDRVGLNGRLFRVYKFRTMSVGNPGESDTRWTTSNDPRRTRLGAFLRATNLDELPQFFNVLKGEMSVVGPRPERPYFVKKFQDDVAQYNTRHYLKVGITGWAQVNGWRGDTSISKRVEHDLYYLRNWSLWFDMKIIWLTLWRGFFSKNAY
jgi:Undecaprenyl-phosphate glucose phosphotransferase